MKVGDRVRLTSEDDGGVSRTQRGFDVRGTVTAITETDSGRVVVEWDTPTPEIPTHLWPEDLEPLDTVSKLGELGEEAL